MALSSLSTLSDGELCDDDEVLSNISSGEEEYFKSYTKEIKKRKMELELENELQRIDDYAKENHFKENGRRQHRASSVTSSSKKSMTSYKPLLRPPSIYSPVMSFPRRRKTRRGRRRPKAASINQFRDRSQEIEIDDNDVILIEDGLKKDDEEEDEVELMALRLNALKSKLELKEIQINVQEDVPEEEQLRIDALKSALLKKKDHFKVRKQLRKLEKERPYSPTDHLESMLDENDEDFMELSNSPIHSPFHDIHDEVDMEISSDVNSPVEMQLDNELENTYSSDMEVASSPTPRTEELDESEEKTTTQEDDDVELRKFLLTSIKDRKEKEGKNIALLKKTVQRLLQKPKPSPSPPPPALPTIQPKKSGTKTIKEVLEEKKNKRELKESIIDPNERKLIDEISEQQNVTMQSVPSSVNIIDNGELDNYLSTITDTKNIPLLPQKPEEVTKKRDSRMITSLESIKRPVQPLVITINPESTDDEEFDEIQRRRRTSSTKSLTNPQVNIEKQVESFLKKIRIQSEKTANSPKLPQTSSSTSTTPTQNKIRSPIKYSTPPSAVNHLPKSSQIEYAMLLEKMNKLEEAKTARLKARQLKRSKSNSSIKEDNKKPTPIIAAVKKDTLSVQSGDLDASKRKESAKKIEDTFSMIPQLNEDAKERFALNAENKYLTHSDNLKESTERTLKLIDESSLDVRRRNKIDSKIDELEKALLKFRGMRKVIDQRIHVGLPKIAQSQIALVKLRNHQASFGKICSRVGEMVRGSEYRLPEGVSDDINRNLMSIVEKSEKLQSSCSDHFAIKHLKSYGMKIKSFLKEDQKVLHSKLPEDNAKESSAIEETMTIVTDPVTTKGIIQDNIDSSSESTTAKRVKYESPLDFQTVPTVSEDNLNQIVCPFALDSSCKDVNCKMLHL